MRRTGIPLALLLPFVLALVACASEGEDPPPGSGNSPPTSTLISAAEGGSVSDAAGNATLTIPPGALAEDTEITLSVAAATKATISKVYDFGPDGLEFLIPAKLEVAVDPEKAGDRQVVLAVEQEGVYVALPGSSYVAGVASANVEHFSKFAAVGEKEDDGEDPDGSDPKDPDTGDKDPTDPDPEDSEPCAGADCKPTVIATGESLFPFRLAANGSEVFWLNTSSDRGIYKASVEGGDPVALHVDDHFSANAITLDESHVYAGGDSGLFKVSQEGGPITNLLSLVTACAIGVHQGNLYWLSNGHGLGKDLQRIPIAGGTPTTAVNLFDNGCTFFISGDTVFLTTPSIARVPLSGGTPTEIIAPSMALSDRASADTLLSDDSNLYWMDGSKMHIASVPKTGGAITVLAELTPADGELLLLAHKGLVRIGSSLYWWDPKTRNIMRTPTSGGDSEIVIAEQENLKAMASDGTSIYWSMYDANGGTLMRLRP